MKLEDLISLFSEQCVYKPVLRAPGSPKRPTPEKYDIHIYTLDNIADLIEKLRAMPDQGTLNDDKYSIRYLVTPTGQILFAREGKAGLRIKQYHEIIPAHKEIHHRCIAAGNLFFNHDYTQITSINNSSGDFLPLPNCLVWPIKALKDSGLTFAEKFTLNIFHPKNFVGKPVDLELTAEHIRFIEELGVEIPELVECPHSPYVESDCSEDDAKSACEAGLAAQSFFSEAALASSRKKTRLSDEPLCLASGSNTL